jgi:hypothetical protein
LLDWYKSANTDAEVAAEAATHERVRVGQQPRGACDEDDLRMLMQADEQAPAL